MKIFENSHVRIASKIAFGVFLIVMLRVFRATEVDFVYTGF